MHAKLWDDKARDHERFLKKLNRQETLEDTK
jgi:hypothetical protein